MPMIFPTENMTIGQKQKCGLRFVKEVIKASNSSLPGTGWKKKSSWFFKAHEGWYFTSIVTGGYKKSGNTLDPMSMISTFGLKPLAVDPINWTIHGLSENISEPLSFRSDAAHQLRALTVSTLAVHSPFNDVMGTSKSLIDLLFRQEKIAKDMIAKTSFENLILKSDQADKKKALLWATLISEGRGTEALSLIEKEYLDPIPDHPRTREIAYGIIKRYRAYIERA